MKMFTKRLKTLVDKYIADKSHRFKYMNLSFEDICKLSRNDSYKYFHEYYHHESPTWLKNHRRYFSKNLRSFGEDAFHAMWFHILNQFKPFNILEIGVYRGSTLSLFALISQKNGVSANINGISPFSSVGDSVSKYLKGIDYKQDIYINFDAFGIERPNLHEGYSESLEMNEVFQLEKWDLIFIDGNHDEEIVRSDLERSIDNISDEGIIVVDDSALFTDLDKLSYATRGHMGPSIVVDKFLNEGRIIEVLSCGHNRVFKKVKM
jgi:hypothetical protein